MVHVLAMIHGRTSQTLMTEPQQSAIRQPLRRWLPALLLLAVIAAGYALGLHHYLSLAALAEHRDQLKLFVAQHLLAALLIYMAVYIAVVAASIPGAAVLSIAGGFLFSWIVSVPVTVTAATIGAVIVFQIVKTSLGAALAERAGPLARKLAQGFAENAFSLLLFLRLVPAFPFFAVNAVAGLCRVPLRTFVLATVIGIIPASVAFALVGSGLDAAIGQQMEVYRACLAAGGAQCSFSVEPSALITRELVFGFAALGLVALLPLAVKAWKARRG